METEAKCCLWCGQELMQRKDEPLHNFGNRRYCDKRHSAFHSNERRKPTKKHIGLFLAPLTVPV